MKCLMKKYLILPNILNLNPRFSHTYLPTSKLIGFFTCFAIAKKIELTSHK